jgi:hypothetical protein
LAAVEGIFLLLFFIPTFCAAFGPSDFQISSPENSLKISAGDTPGPTIFAEDFLHFLLEGNVKFAVNGWNEDECMDADGVRIVLSVLTESIQEFVGKVMTFIEKGIEPIDCVVDGDYATVRFSVRWAGLMAETLTKTTFSGVACIKMRRSPYQGWDVIQAVVPGWNA